MEGYSSTMTWRMDTLGLHWDETVTSREIWSAALGLLNMECTWLCNPCELQHRRLKRKARARPVNGRPLLICFVLCLLFVVVGFFSFCC